MILGIGLDIESIGRFKKSCKSSRFLEMVFTKKEIEYCNSKKRPHMSFAGKFCAKEAVIKSYSESISLRDVEIINDKAGKIIVFVRGKITKIKCSISHTDEYAAAFAVREK